MAKKEKDIETEMLIKRTAKKLFFVDGKFNATTQDIADEAGVNRTLINYYFRSRNNLLNLIFETAIQREEELRHEYLSSDLGFKEKIELYIDHAIQQAIAYPYLETYIVSRINDGCFFKEEEKTDFTSQFVAEFEKEVKKGTIEEISPIQFMLNLTSLISFPFAIRPLIQQKLKISDDEYVQIISDRKKIIMNMLFKKTLNES